MSNYSHSLKIAVDAMGGDFGVQSAIPGCAGLLKRHSQVKFLIFGDEQQIGKHLDKYADLKAASEIIHTDKVVGNDDKPRDVMRSGGGTSMWKAIEAVHYGKAQAVVSSGNTGALMALAMKILKRVDGIRRPAIASVFPGIKGETIMLDLGGNAIVDGEALVQFAILGSAFARAHKDIAAPRVGLLNMGTEEEKGPEHVKKAHKILKDTDFSGNYVGYVEGNDITAGTVDVVVSDGYAGNIALKTAEGVGKLTGGLFRQAIKSDPLAILGGMLAFPALKRFKTRLDPRRYNGGVFLGLNGVCIKSHGGSDEVGFESALNLAVELVQHGYIQNVTNDINHLMEQPSLLSID